MSRRLTPDLDLLCPRGAETADEQFDYFSIQIGESGVPQLDEFEPYEGRLPRPALAQKPKGKRKS
ncbi:MAG: hypothetical protein ACXWCW_28695 [Burkholderiales bacterium]